MGVGADGKAGVGLVWGGAEEGLYAGVLVVAELEEGGVGAVGLVGLKVGDLEGEHLVGGGGW